MTQKYGASVGDEYGFPHDSIQLAVDDTLKTLTEDAGMEGPHPDKEIEVWKFGPITLDRFISAHHLAEAVFDEAMEAVWEAFDLDEHGEAVAGGIPDMESEAHKDLIDAIQSWMNAFDSRGSIIPTDHIVTLIAEFNYEADRYGLGAISSFVLGELIRAQNSK